MGIRRKLIGCLKKWLKVDSLKAAPRKEKMKWLIGTNVFNMLDAASTVAFTACGLSELNPAMSFLLENHLVAFVAIKILVMLWISYRWVRSEKWWALRLTTIVFCGIVVWNIIQLAIKLTWG